MACFLMRAYLLKLNSWCCSLKFDTFYEMVCKIGGEHMVEKRTPISVEEAVNRVIDYAKNGETEIVHLEESDGCVLGEDILATHPVPPFNKSPYDGFAFRAEDTVNGSQDNPITFKVVEHIAAGNVATKPLHKGEAVRIMTGAQIPEDANCVAMFEVCQTYEEFGEEFMSIKRKMNPGDNVNVKGSETEQGTKLVHKGSVINPGIKALLATFGYAEIQVAKRPKVGLFATGTELLSVEDPLVPGKIRNSNAPMIASQITRAGAEVEYLGTLQDDFETSYIAISKALEYVDVLITTGGVSVGDYDLMPDIYKEIGADVLFNKVAMRPGSVTTVAAKGNQLLFGLSGNPSACYVGFELFTRPILRSLLGSKNVYPPKIKAYLGEDFPKANPFTRFVRASLTYKEGNVYVEPSGMDKSSVVTSLTKANAFIMLPGGTRGYQKDDLVEALLIEAEDGDADTWTL